MAEAVIDLSAKSRDTVPPVLHSTAGATSCLGSLISGSKWRSGFSLQGLGLGLGLSVAGSAARVVEVFRAPPALSLRSDRPRTVQAASGWTRSNCDYLLITQNAEDTTWRGAILAWRNAEPQYRISDANSAATAHGRNTRNGQCTITTEPFRLSPGRNALCIYLRYHRSPAVRVVEHVRKWADLAVVAILGCVVPDRAFGRDWGFWTTPRSSAVGFALPMRKLPLDTSRAPIVSFLQVGVHLLEIGGNLCQVDPPAVLEPFLKHETPFPRRIMIPSVGFGVEHESRWGKSR
ncbi:Succinate dehydrogenase cytochrome B subunit [Fusarium oxysporum f. sp. albedinis]|nr:Succinate dehydrogenase cytochrome B subunit [Fusarium oxysporum f. sp. albedinis]